MEERVERKWALFSFAENAVTGNQKVEQLKKGCIVRIRGT